MSKTTSKVYKVTPRQQLIDLNNEDIKKIELKKIIPGKKIKSVEVLVKIEPK